MIKYLLTFLGFFFFFIIMVIAHLVLPILAYIAIFSLPILTIYLLLQKPTITNTLATIPQPEKQPIPSVHDIKLKLGIPVPLFEPNQFMSAQQKQEHLESIWYQNLRKQILERDNFCCVECGSTLSLCVHHTNYLRLGEELPTDLVTLCRSCHDWKHIQLGLDRKQIYLVCKA